MRRTIHLLSIALLVAAPAAYGASFSHRPFLAEDGVDVLNRSVTRTQLERDLFDTPWATVVVGRVDVYDEFPYVESRWYQVVSDVGWNRLLVGEIGGDLTAWDGSTSAFGKLDEPRGLAVDENGRLYVADSGNHRVLVFDSWTEFGQIELTVRYTIENLSRPYDVAYSDGGTPFNASDDRLYIAEAGANRVSAFDLHADRAEFRAAIGELGSGAGFFAGPLALAVGRENGVCTDDVYVADAHNGRIVRLEDTGTLIWRGEVRHDAGAVTSLDVDHWGSLYAAAPKSHRVDKFTADLHPLARVETLDRPRAFHVPFATRTDHRTGVREFVGQGAGVVVEQWNDTTGLRLLQIGADVDRLTVSADQTLRADFRLTDRADARLELLDDAYSLRYRTEPIRLNAGDASISVSEEQLAGLPAGEYTVRVSSESTYQGSPGGSAEALVFWSGSSIIGADRVVIASTEPNPFRAATTIRYAVPASTASHSVTIFDVSGRRVRELVNGSADAGLHSVSWDGRDSAGRGVASGVYLVRVAVGAESSIRKVVHLR